MNKIKAGFIGFLTEEEQKDPYAALAHISKLGYRGFEAGDLLLQAGDPVENLKRVQELDIEPLSINVQLGAPLEASEIVKRAKLIGVNRATIFAGMVEMHFLGFSEHTPTYDDLMRETESYDNLAKDLCKEGITLSFHNHHAEFLTCFDGIPSLYLMKEKSEYLKFEIDCGWVSYAGYDPVTVLRSMGDRLAAIHIKDYIDGVVDMPLPGEKTISMPRFVTPGTGKLELNNCLQTASDMGLDYAIIEQDFQHNLTHHETLTAAYLNMKESGFVE